MAALIKENVQIIKKKSLTSYLLLVYLLQNFFKKNSEYHLNELIS